MKYRIKGLDKYIQQLENLSNVNYTRACIELAVDEGSRVADEYTVRELNNLPTDDDPQRKPKRRGIRTIQKRFLLRTFGVSPSDNDRGFINEKTGVNREVIRYKDRSGYTPAVVLARQLENGTSYLNRDPVFSRASRKARKSVIEAMEKSFNKSIEEIYNGKFKFK